MLIQLLISIKHIYSNKTNLFLVNMNK